MGAGSRDVLGSLGRARLHVPAARERGGMDVEPGYEVTLRGGIKHRGLGIAGGLLIGR